MVSTVWSVSCLLFFYLRFFLCPAICKSGEHVPRCPMESVPVMSTVLTVIACVTITIESSTKRCNNFVSYEFIWILRTSDCVQLDVYQCVLFRGSVGIRFSV